MGRAIGGLLRRSAHEATSMGRAGLSARRPTGGQLHWSAHGNTKTVTMVFPEFDFLSGQRRRAMGEMFNKAHSFS